MDPQACPCPVLDILYWEQPDQSEAVSVKSLEQSISLNLTGRMIWGLCDGAHTRQDMLQELKTYFGDAEDSTLGHDLDEYLDELLAQGYLWIPGSTT